MYAQLGDIIFEALIGFESFQRTREVKYAEHELMNRQSRLQPTATGLNKIAVTIAFQDNFCVPEDEIAKFENYMLNSEVVPLLFGNGRYIGDFVISDISESILQTYPNGDYMEARLTFNLIEVASSERDNREAIKKQQSASALQSNKPNTIRGQPKSYLTPQGQITTSTIFAMSEANQCDSFMKRMLIEGGFSDHWATLIEDGLTNIQKYIGVTSDILAGNLGTIGVLAPSMPLDIGRVLNSVSDLKSAILVTDVTGMIGANGSLQQNMESLRHGVSYVDIKTILRLPL